MHASEYIKNLFNHLVGFFRVQAADIRDNPLDGRFIKQSHSCLEVLRSLPGVVKQCHDVLFELVCRQLGIIGSFQYLRQLFAQLGGFFVGNWRQRIKRGARGVVAAARAINFAFQVLRSTLQLAGILSVHGRMIAIVEFHHLNKVITTHCRLMLGLYGPDDAL